MKKRLYMSFALLTFLIVPHMARANPWNGKVVLQAFWWDCWNQKYAQDWYTYLAKLCPRLREMGFDGIWIPSPAKGNAGINSMGYDIFDHYDLGDKEQKGTLATRFGNKDSLLRLIAVAHANGLEVYPDIVLNHTMGGEKDDAAPGDPYKRFRYVGFGGPESGRWPKDHWNFHPNPDHECTEGDWCEQLFGPDICYLDAEHGGGGNGLYMRAKAREWFVWLYKQTGADGFRFDAVKHFPAYVVEDLLYNARGEGTDYFAVGEFVGSRQQLDDWVEQTKNRCGTFDFPLREALAQIVREGGYFNLGGLPNYQQGNRHKTVPFVNNHDSWRGSYWDSNPGSDKHDDKTGDWRQNDAELIPTIDPDNPRADLVYAAAFAVDGSPMVYYEDLFVNDGPERFNADPDNPKVRDYLINIIWAHQKLDFKDGAYKVRFQSSPDLLVVERSAKALIGLNDHGSTRLSTWVATDFGPRFKLHDYSGSSSADLETNEYGWVKISVPPMGYAIWGPAEIRGGFSPQRKRTTQEFQLDDDLGDSSESALRYGGKINQDEYRTAGSIWVAANSLVRVWMYTDGGRDVGLIVRKPDEHGAKSRTKGAYQTQGKSSNEVPLYFEFIAEREGYHQLLAKVTGQTQLPTRAYLKVEYEAPAGSNKF